MRKIPITLARELILMMMVSASRMRSNFTISYSIEENLFTEEVNASYPKQDNSSDCGIFMLKGIEFGSRLAKRTFTCKDTVYLRYLIAFELYTGNLLS